MVQYILRTACNQTRPFQNIKHTCLRRRLLLLLRLRTIRPRVAVFVTAPTVHGVGAIATVDATVAVVAIAAAAPALGRAAVCIPTAGVAVIVAVATLRRSGLKTWSS